MSIKVGDKFIIEIGTIAELPDGKKKYFIKPFESLVFDRKGLEQLERLDKATGNIYQKGLEDGKKCLADSELERIWEDKLDQAKKEGYDKGYLDGKANAAHDPELIHGLKAKERKIGYDVGYSQGIEDCEKAIDTLGSFTLEELEEKFGTRVFTGVLLENPLLDIVAITKAYEEKKKAEEDTIKVGDVVRYNKKCHQYDLVKDREYLVLHVIDNDTCTLLYDNGDTCCACLNILEPTGRHIDEVSQLLDKLRGKENNE